MGTGEQPNITTLGSLSGLTISGGQTVDIGSNKITNVANPTADQDVATKAYVDSNMSSAGATNFLQLTDTPSSLTANKFLAVNAAGNALEFVDAPSGGGGSSSGSSGGSSGGTTVASPETVDYSVSVYNNDYVFNTINLPTIDVKVGSTYNFNIDSDITATNPFYITTSYIGGQDAIDNSILTGSEITATYPPPETIDYNVSLLENIYSLEANSGYTLNQEITDFPDMTSTDNWKLTVNFLWDGSPTSQGWFGIIGELLVR